ncbi:MAG: phosphotransferase [Paludibacteraceae bacterium]|nr:phosphotransferase [Paludibacteraceae bacterium]
MEIEVIGNSGCKVEVVREDTKLFILKSTADAKYAERLVLQAEKQKKASAQSVPNIIVPKVYRITRPDNGAEIRMDYVYSQNYIDYFENAGVHEIDTFVEAMITFVENEISQSPMTECPVEALVAKFNEVAKKVAMRKDYSAEMQNLQIKAKRQINEHNTLQIPIGMCHGDLTFSNILFCGQQYCLIDFLDSFVETPLQDIVKLRQDSQYLWSCLMYQQPYDALRLKLISQYIDEKLDEHFSRYEWYKQYYGIMQLMNMLRILPYAKEEKVVNYLLRVINTLV